MLHFRRAAAVALLVGGLAGGLAACGSGGSGDAAEASPSASAPSSETSESSSHSESESASASAAEPVSEEARREAIYLETTAEHLCAVQSRVYADPAEIAPALASRPRYAELTEAEVAEFEERAKTDPAFVVRLGEAVTAACSASPAD